MKERNIALVLLECLKSDSLKRKKVIASDSLEYCISLNYGSKRSALSVTLAAATPSISSSILPEA